MKTAVSLRASVLEPSGSERTLALHGRNAWALQALVENGARGCTPIDVPGPRWSSYVHRLRRDYGLTIETIEELHGGPFPGRHARYVLRDRVRIIELSESELCLGSAP